MSLIYRAIWQDDAEGIHERALASFRWWVGRRHPGERSFTVGATETDGDTTTMVRTGQGEAGSIQRCTLHVDDGTDRVTTTLVTTATAAGDASVWVDRERVSRRAFATHRVRAPALSAHLIATGRAPRRGPVTLAVRPQALRAHEIPAFTALLGDAHRDLPLLVLAPGTDLDAAALREPGAHAAQVLAGSAAVYLIGGVGRVNLAEILGPDLAVPPGGARLFLPGVSPSEPVPSRHRVLEPSRVARDPMALAHTILQFLAPATALQRAPAEYPALRPLLHADTDTLVAENESLEARVHDLEAQLAHVEDQVLELLADLEDAESRVNLLQAALDTRQTAGDPAARADGAEPPPPDVDGLVAAARAAQRHLTGIVLPDAACRDLAELDRRIESGAWGRTAWRGLLALDAFARDRDFKPGFWEWCRANRSPYAWPATQKKLAMRESETVMSSDTLRRHRLLPVDEAVSPEGRIEMQAHLKIAEGGNHQIPRIYFHDDRHGATGKVHIGFFGPHRHVPNTLT